MSDWTDLPGIRPNTTRTINPDGTVRQGSIRPPNPGGLTHIGYTGPRVSPPGSAPEGSFNGFYADINPNQTQEERDLAMAIGQLNALFGVGLPGMRNAVREPVYGQVRDDVYGLQANRLNENREDTLRQLRFGLARTGLSGGSADVSAQGLEQRQFGRALMDANQSAQSAADEVRANDERTRLNLISQMRAGLDAGNATQNALSQMTNNVNAAKGATQYAAVDSYAQAMQPALARYQIQQGVQQARRDHQPLYPMAKPNSGTIIQGSF